jgi:hypothetical protein
VVDHLRSPILLFQAGRVSRAKLATCLPVRQDHDGCYVVCRLLLSRDRAANTQPGVSTQGR